MAQQCRGRPPDILGILDVLYSSASDQARLETFPSLGTGNAITLLNVSSHELQANTVAAHPFAHCCKYRKNVGFGRVGALLSTATKHNARTAASRKWRAS